MINFEINTKSKIGLTSNFKRSVIVLFVTDSHGELFMNDVFLQVKSSFYTIFN